MPNNITIPQALDILRASGYDSLDKIPDLLVTIYEERIDKIYPEATKWLEDFYSRMKVSIRKEFEDGPTAAKTA
jgi:hypothetical protein